MFLLVLLFNNLQNIVQNDQTKALIPLITFENRLKVNDVELFTKALFLDLNRSKKLA